MVNGEMGKTQKTQSKFSPVWTSFRFPLVLAISLFHYFTISLSFAAFKDPGYGARPAGMGNAFTAVADDVNAALFNPAGLAQIPSRQMAFSHAKPFTGLDDVNLNLNFFSAVLPVGDLGSCGVAWSNLVAPVYRENTVTLSAASSLNRWLPDMKPYLAVGVNVNALQNRFDLDDRTAGDSVFANGRSENAVAFDLGLYMKPDPDRLPGLTLGAMGKSLNQPGLGLVETEQLKRELAGGAAYSFEKLTLSADLVRRDDVDTWRAGVESWFRQQTLGLRAGANSTAASAGFTVLFRAGRQAGIFLDYAYSIPFQVEDTAGSHRLALGLVF